MKITDLRVQHIISPMGYRIDAPDFSWKLEADETELDTMVVSTRLTVATDPGMENVAAESVGVLNPLGTEMEMALRPRTVYYWQVTETLSNAEVVSSDVQSFETGKMEEPWTAQWITCEKGDRHPVFFKEFGVTKPVKAARLYITGLGVFCAFMNDARIGDEYLTPLCTDYENTIQYMTYDVTEMLKAENKLSVLLGEGWYMGRFGFVSQPGQPGMCDPAWKLIAELHMAYEDGTEEVIATDDSWQAARSNITFSSIYDGEHRDDTLPKTAPEKTALLEKEKVEALHLKERLSLPVTIQEVMKPIALLTTPKNEKVFDLGQNITGSFRLSVNEPAGTVIRVKVGEILQQDCFYRDNLRTAIAEYVYVSDGEPKVIEPYFTFYGYRYAMVEGIREPKLEDFTGLALSSALTVTGSLKTGDAKLNQLISNIFWGQRDNFLDVPTDCPQRDERMGWTADTQVFVPMACYNMNTYAFYSKFLADLRTEQDKFDGCVPVVVPAFGFFEASSVWGDAATIIPWDLYLYYGDPYILKRSIGSMAAWTDYITRMEADDHAWRKHFHYGDWLALDNMNGKVDEVFGATDNAFIADVYYYNSALLTMKAAKVIGDAAAEEKYARLSKELYQMIRDEYFTATGRLAIQTQTACVIALYYDLAPDRARIIATLLEMLKKNNDHFNTGFVGTPLISKALSMEGADKTAYKILHNEEYPGWLYEVNLGATTVWERWNSVNPDGSISSTGMNSLNHYAYGSIGEWMWQNAGAIAPVEEAPGFKKAMMRLVPDMKTGSVEACYDSASGLYKTSWEVLDAAHVHAKVTVPYGCTATLKLVYAVDEALKCQELKAGTYEFTYEVENLEA